MKLHIEEITTEERFASISDEWNDLLQKSSSNEITLTWEWLHTWWTVFKDPTRRLKILVVKTECGDILGIAPFQISTIRKYPFLPKLKQLEFLATREDEADEICSDYLNFIIMKDHEHDVLTCIMDYLVNDITGQWDEIYLDNVLSTSVEMKEIEGIVTGYPLRYESAFKTNCYYIELPDTWDELLAGQSKKQRRNINTSFKLLEKDGNFTFVDVTDEPSLERGLEALTELHQSRWNEKGEPGVFSSNKFIKFHRSLLSQIMNKGWLQFKFLLVDDKPLAALYNFKYNSKIYSYQTGIRPHKRSAISPGFIIHGACIREGIMEGVKEYDFLGGEYEYKKKWSKTFRDLSSITISNLNMKAKIYSAVRSSEDILRKTKRNFLTRTAYGNN